MAVNCKNSRLSLVIFLAPLASAFASFPETVDLPPGDGNAAASLRLQKTGEAERKFLFFPIYEIAHYLLMPYEEDVPVHESRQPRAVHLVFQRKISGRRIRDDFLELLRERTTEDEWRAIRESARAYADPFARGEVRKGDRFELSWTPESGLVSRFNGEPLSRIKNPLFTRILWSSWTGPNSVLDREALLGEVLSSSK